MEYTCGTHLLRSRYRLSRGPVSEDETSQSWIAFADDDEQEEFIIKLWPYQGAEPDPYQRALWDAELRTLYRLGSSPAAEETLIVIKDAGVDREAGAFVMVLKGGGYDTLADSLTSRTSTPWLATREPVIRKALWEGISSLVEGLLLLHEQRVLHRNIRPEVVYLDSRQGPPTFRLGGFEWSIRLGFPAGRTPPPSWSSPPEFFLSDAPGHTNETDWFSLGILIARCMLNLEPYKAKTPLERHMTILREIDKARPRELSDLERHLIRQLILQDPAERLTRGHSVKNGIKEILQFLGEDGTVSRDERPLVLVLDPKQHNIVERALDQNFVPEPDMPFEPFNYRNDIHALRLAEFVREDLQKARIYPSTSPLTYILDGGLFTFRIGQFENFDDNRAQRSPTWDAAFCIGLADLRVPDFDVDVVELPEESIVVKTTRQIRRGGLKGPRSWKSVLPEFKKFALRRATLGRFHDFVRCTNQLELLMRTGELFSYSIVGQVENEDGLSRIAITEADSHPLTFKLFQVEGGMVEFLIREIESDKQDCRLVALDSSNDLGFYSDRLPRELWWEIEDIDSEKGQVALIRRKIMGTITPPPREGTLRTYGLTGQLALIRRRKEAIDRLVNHSYLIRSLSSPGEVIMTTGEGESLAIPLSSEDVDESKQAAIADILNTRPIYALQGPPGTGKTTLVAHLIREILADDPVAQILVTAQAHGAVDVLRAKVESALKDVPLESKPLAVRLRAPQREDEVIEGSVVEVARKLVEQTIQRLRCITRNSLQDEWLTALDRMRVLLEGSSATGEASDFCEIVKRGANLTYCTTSAGDLDALAKSSQSFDWSIVEEAGRAHGCDLALPLQAGHRWLLIGDHKQLPPYRINDYARGLTILDDAAEALRNLPRASSLVDYDWLRTWRDKPAQQREDFTKYAEQWLNTFEKIFKNSSRAFGVEKITVNKSIGAAAGQLSRQHRMHPDIGNFVSTCFYDDIISNETEVGGVPKDKVLHNLRLPSYMGKRSIVWVDLPWSRYERDFKELGPSDRMPKYTNLKEVDAIRAFITSLELSDKAESLELAVLSPYSRQVALVQKNLGRMSPPSGITFKRVASSRKGGGRGEPWVAHTVDGFQGNQADIVIVSLVRNNPAPPTEGLGFVKEGQRLNVLLSRAERLLVLVGSWEFFRDQVSPISLTDRKSELWHLAKALEVLSELFDSGKAVKVPYEAIL